MNKSSPRHISFVRLASKAIYLALIKANREKAILTKQLNSLYSLQIIEWYSKEGPLCEE